MKNFIVEPHDLQLAQNPEGVFMFFDIPWSRASLDNITRTVKEGKIEIDSGRWKGSEGQMIGIRLEGHHSEDNSWEVIKLGIRVTKMSQQLEQFMAEFQQGHEDLQDEMAADDSPLGNKRN